MDYRPLDFSAFEFRLLALLPSENTNAPIHCLLSYEVLIEPPEYRALSYCWGDQDVTEEIFVNERSVQVGTNLKSALKELRAQGLLVLWADALCINQKDLLERGLQVMRMGLIYSRAVEVVVWLGEEADDSAMVMTEAGGSSRKVLVPESNHSGGIDMTLKAVTSARTPRHTIIEGGALTSLFQRPYWKRVWIIQEVSKARRLLVICGTYSIPFDRLFSYLNSIGIYPPEASSLLAFRMNELNVFWNGQTTRPRLITNLVQSTRFLASDDRDKIYALLGLSADGADIVPTPNYQQPSAKVYFDTFKAMLSREKNFAWLFRGAVTTMTTDLVPRWTDITRGLPFFLVKLVLNEQKSSETRAYWDSIPREYSFKENPQLSISFSGLHVPIHFIDILTSVATRFGMYSSSRPCSQQCILSAPPLEQDSGMGREFLLTLWRVMRADRVRRETGAQSSIRPPGIIAGSSFASGWNSAQADMVVPSLGHLCLLSKWQHLPYINSDRDIFWHWLFNNQNLVYKQKTIRYWIEAYSLSAEYLDFAKDMEPSQPGLLQRLFPRVHPTSSRYRECEFSFLESMRHAIKDQLRLAIGSNTMELMPNEVKEGDAICRIRYARREIVLRPKMDGYRFVVALSPKYDFREYSGRWNGWPKGLKRNIPTKWSSEVVLGFNMKPTYDQTFEKFSQADNVEENWQIVNIC